MNTHSPTHLPHILLLLVSILLSAPSALAQDPAYDVTVSNQTEFDRLLASRSTNETSVLLKPGSYYIDGTRHIHAKLNIHGDKAVIKQKNKLLSRHNAVRETATHYICTAPDISTFSLFVDAKGDVIRVSEAVDPSTQVDLIDSDIIPLPDPNTGDVENIKFKIPANLSHLKNKTFDKAFGNFDSWWSTVAFDLTHSDSQYFYATLLVKRKGSQFKSYINGEMATYHQPAACVIFNVAPQPDRIFFDSKEVYIPKGIDSVEVIDSSFPPLFMLEPGSDLSLQGVDFTNCSDIFQNAHPFDGSLSLKDCHFTNTLKRAFLLIGSRVKSLSIEDCSFSNYSLYFFAESAALLRVYTTGASGRIANCTFNQYPDGFCYYKNVFAPVYINNAKEFEVYGSTFVNHPRGPIFIMNGKVDVSSNIIYNDPTFNSHSLRNFSRDGGGIYCNRLYDENRHSPDNPNRIQLRLNTIHDMIGHGDIRGIFIDDGRGDVSCYGNVIYSGQSYSIDSRVVGSDPYSSIRNQYSWNVLGYHFRLTYGPDISPKERPVADHNVLLYPASENKTTSPAKSDIRATGFDISDGRLFLSTKTWKKLPKDVRQIVSQQ